MLTQIVVLYIAYTYELPVWCKAMVITGMILDAIRFMCEIYNAGRESK